MRKTSLALCVCLTLPLFAITYGWFDGDAHPNVGALISNPDLTSYELCSGTLIAPQVFLTAAHCTQPLQDMGMNSAWVTFDPAYSTGSKFYPGTLVTNPNYNKSQSDPGDIAVVLLDEPVDGIAPAALPPAGLLNQLRDSGALQDMPVTAVGYGLHQRDFSGTGKPQFSASTVGSRWAANSSFNSLTTAWLRLSQNVHLDNGGTCYGDSGGPNFVNAGGADVLVAITITGDTQCVATNVTYRLDTPSARTFLQNYVPLP